MLGLRMNFELTESFVLILFTLLNMCPFEYTAVVVSEKVVRT